MMFLRLPYRVANIAKRQMPLWSIVLLVIALFAILAPFADRDGYEGDDLSSVVPMMYLPAAKAGAFLIYRYDWQPLAYEMGAALYKIAGTPDIVFLLAPAAAALTIALLIALIRPQMPIVAALGLVLLAPELIISSLYYNSTILGLPLLVGAMLLARRPGHMMLLLAGLCLALAILLRLDFILTAPALGLFAAEHRGDLRAGLGVALGCLATLAAAVFLSLLDPAAVVSVYHASAQEIADKATTPGWDLRTKLLVSSTLLSPLGWAATGVGVILVVIHTARQSLLRLILWLMAAAPLFLLIAQPLSPKYGLPLIPFWVMLMAAAVRLTGSRANPHGHAIAGSVLLAAGALQALISISPQRPFVGLAPQHLVSTHDGARAYGGTLWLIRDLASVGNEQPEQREAQAITAQVLAGRHITWRGGQNMFDPGGTGWRRAAVLLARAGAVAKPIRPGQLIWRAPSGGTLLLMAEPHPPLAGAR